MPYLQKRQYLSDRFGQLESGHRKRPRGQLRLLAGERPGMIAGYAKVCVILVDFVVQQLDPAPGPLRAFGGTDYSHIAPNKLHINPRNSSQLDEITISSSAIGNAAFVRLRQLDGSLGRLIHDVFGCRLANPQLR